MWHAVALPRRSQGPPLGFVHSSAHTAWLTVNWCSRSMDRRLGLRWTESTLLPSSLVHVHRVQACVAGEKGFLCFLPRRAPAGGVLTGELLRRRWRPIEVGKKHRQASACTVVGSRWRPGLPRALATVFGGSAWRCSPAGHLGAVLGVLVPRFLSDG